LVLTIGFNYCGELWLMQHSGVLEVIAGVSSS